eukprot:g3764.t1
MYRVAIFCRKLTPNDEDATVEELQEAILHYYPSVDDDETRLSFMGMCLGFIDFTSTFTTDDKVETVHLNGSRIALFECEEDTWFALEVETPSTRRGSADSQSPAAAADARAKFTDGHCVPSDAVLCAIVRDMYEMYKLFRGPILTSLFPPLGNDCDDGDGSVHRLQESRRKLRKAKRYSDMLERGDLKPGSVTLKQQALMDALQDGSLQEELARCTLESTAEPIRLALGTLIPMYLDKIDFTHLHFFYDLDGFHFFPIEKDTYGEVFSFASDLEMLFPEVQQMAVLYMGHIAWNTIKNNHLRLLIKFLRYHEMLSSDGYTSKNSENWTRGGGFMSTVRGVYVDADVGKGKSSIDSKAVPEQQGTSSKIPSALDIFTPPLCVDVNGIGSGTNFHEKTGSPMRSFSIYHRTGSGSLGAALDRGNMRMGTSNNIASPSSDGENHNALQNVPSSEMAASIRKARTRLVVLKEGAMILVLVVNVELGRSASKHWLCLKRSTREA